MSVLTATVVLAWGCLVVLTLAMAGMLGRGGTVNGSGTDAACGSP